MGLEVLTFGQVLENYEESWTTYSSGNWWERNDQIQFKVNVVDFGESYLKMQIPCQSTLFIDGKLWEYFRSDTVRWIPLRDLRTLNLSDTATFTFILFDSHLSSAKVSLQKVVKPTQPTAGITSDFESTGRLTRKSNQSVKDFFVVAFLCNLIFLALYKLAYPYLLGVLLHPISVFNADDFSDSGSLQKFLSPDILFYMVIVSMMISQIGVTVLYTQSALILNVVSEEFWSLIMFWTIGILIVFGMLIVKFVGIRISGFFFDFGKNDFAHFFYLLRLIVFGSVAILFVLAFFVSNRLWELEWVLEFMISGFFWFYLLGILGLFLIMMNRLNFKKYHLFTYLCIAELIPFLILSKWILVLLK